MADYSTYTAEELATQKALIDEQIATLNAEKQAIAAAEDKLLVYANAMRKTENLTPAEKAALVQIITVQGIPSEGGVGTPGA